MKTFQGNMELVVDDEGKERIFATFNSPQGVQIKRVEVSVKKPKAEPEKENDQGPEEKTPAETTPEKAPSGSDKK